MWLYEYISIPFTQDLKLRTFGKFKILSYLFRSWAKTISYAFKEGIYMVSFTVGPSILY